MVKEHTFLQGRMHHILFHPIRAVGAALDGNQDAKLSPSPWPYLALQNLS